MKYQIDENTKNVAIAFLKWILGNCTPRQTSRNNLWNHYWKLHDTGVLYTYEEIFDYWNERINK